MIKRGLVLLVLGLLVAMLDWWVEPSIQIITGSETDTEQGETARHSGQSGTLTSADCWFAIPAERSVRCAHWHTQARPGQFSLPVVVIEAAENERRMAPLFYLVGGPGSSSFLEADNIDSWFYWLDDTQLQRDLVLVDQRGTGGSEPQYHCLNYTALVRQVMAEPLTVEEEYQQLYAGIEQCLLRAKAAGFKPHHYSTRLSAADMQGVAEALGYPRWHVMGSSYGTRLALEWARQFPDKIVSLALDSVYPPEKDSLLEWPQKLQQSFQRFWQACEQLVNCDSPAQLEVQFWDTVAMLDAQPLKVEVPLWSGDWDMPVTVTGQRFITLVYQALYSPHRYGSVINAFNEIPQGQTDALLRLATQAVNNELAEEFNPLTYFAVECGETLAGSFADYQIASDQAGQFANYTAPAHRFDICQLFDRHPELAAFRQPINLQQPVLLLSGGLDPVTPAAWAEQLTERLPHGVHWHRPYLSHGVVSQSSCIQQKLGAFFDSPHNPPAQPECD